MPLYHSHVRINGKVCSEPLVVHTAPHCEKARDDALRQLRSVIYAHTMMHGAPKEVLIVTEESTDSGWKGNEPMIWISEEPQ